MSNLIRQHAVILWSGLGIVSTAASTFVLTRISTRKLYQKALDRSQERMNDNAGGKHQATEHGGPLGETKMEPSVKHSIGLTIRRCTCRPIASGITNWPEIRKIMSAFENADPKDCKGSQRDVYRDKIIEEFSLGTEKLSCDTLKRIYESIIERPYQKNGARISK
ncbi:hypothetical protein BCIN_06g01330 [Botrytis cinerea B05.10]|uniref:Uncharacterized protein n=2 Tax=Botryotinia fuckeliana TaxID=40559 RepID=A0A384JJ63_BOTFB|nr:hypothetical protein BCIN_06g01330 [Botrytis cinerea B05.10]ATZ50638.1 hypothetical protein BCIN_06g01330 [Botrytis cinerea B05.10]CCD49173.1 hypothetical protein BofuT4_P030490.1 [Botrytis cinerea T4]